MNTNHNSYNKDHPSLATSVSLLIWSRISMAITPPLLVALSVAGSSWLDHRFAKAEDFDVLVDKFRIVEINSQLLTQRRDSFQDETSLTLREIAQQINKMSNDLATLTAKIEAQERELDRSRGPRR